MSAVWRIVQSYIAWQTTSKLSDINNHQFIMLMDSAGQDIGQGSAEMLYVYSTTSGALVCKKHMAGIIRRFFSLTGWGFDGNG